MREEHTTPPQNEKQHGSVSDASGEILYMEEDDFATCVQCHVALIPAGTQVCEKCMEELMA